MSPFTAFTSVGPLPHFNRGCFMPRDSVVAALGPASDTNAAGGGHMVNGPWHPTSRTVAGGSHGYRPAAGADGVADPRVRQRIAGGCWRGSHRRSPPWRW
jgi:hypothetical protein